VVYQILLKSDDFSLQYGDITINDFQDGGRNLQFMSHDLHRHAILLPYANVIEIEQSAADQLSYNQNNNFQYGGRPVLNFSKVIFHYGCMNVVRF